MLIVYFSNITNNTERLVDKLNVDSSYRIPLKKPDNELLEIREPYILITPTYGDPEGKGAVPHQVKKFLTYSDNSDNLLAVISSGNINFGRQYGIAGEIIAKKFNVPLLYKFELAGQPEDVTKIKNMISLFDTKTTTK